MHRRETLPESTWVVRGDPVERVIRDLQQAEQGRAGQAGKPPPPLQQQTVPRTVKNPPEIGSDRETRPERRSEEHTSELQSRGHLVCRLLLEKKNKNSTRNT